MPVMIFQVEGRISITFEPVDESASVKRVAVESTMVRALAKAITDMSESQRLELAAVIREMNDLSAKPEATHGEVADVIPFNRRTT